MLMPRTPPTTRSPASQRLWLTGELMRVHKAPYSGPSLPTPRAWTAGVPMVQTMLAS
jgi:hypothetical protein